MIQKLGVLSDYKNSLLILNEINQPRLTDIYGRVMIVIHLPAQSVGLGIPRGVTDTRGGHAVCGGSAVAVSSLGNETSKENNNTLYKCYIVNNTSQV